MPRAVGKERIKDKKRNRVSQRNEEKKEVVENRGNKAMIERVRNDYSASVLENEEHAAYFWGSE